MESTQHGTCNPILYGLNSVNHSSKASFTVNFERFTAWRLSYFPVNVKLWESPSRAGGLPIIINDIAGLFKTFSELPERTPEEIEEKKNAYLRLTSGGDWYRLKTLSDIQVAQFFIPKDKEHQAKIITDGIYRLYLAGKKQPVPQSIETALAVAAERKFFHWFLEFPEVFAPLPSSKHSSPLQEEAGRGGFDCILGNPPFLGGQKLSGTFGDTYLERIKYELAPIGAVDLVTYFFRRIFGLIREGGFQSLISTNTIAQGKAREDGLDIIVKQGGSINHAVRSMKWPGKAAVEVALVSITKQNWKGKFVLGGQTVKTITPYLDDAETLGNPYPLKQNENKSFQGSIVLGKGFVLEPHEAAALITKDPKNKDVLFPYLNGDDLNNNPDQSPSRWVINFFDWPEDKARQYPDCYEIVERLVKPERIKMKGDRGAEYWWQFLRMRNELYRTIAPMERVLVVGQVSKFPNFEFTKSDKVLDAKLVIIAFEDFDKYCLLQSGIHYEWITKYATTLETRLNYTPTALFETFPFPKNISLEQKNKLESIGEVYYKHRRQVMLSLQIGLTKTYNLFHKKDLTVADVEKVAKIKEASPPSPPFSKGGNYSCTDKEDGNMIPLFEKEGVGEISSQDSAAEKGYHNILKLRELHVQMDNAVLSTYGWGLDPAQPDKGIDLKHDFYEVDYLPENDRTRFTISPEARKEILKRLLELNHKIHEEEVKAGLWEKNKASKSKTGHNNNAPSLFD